MLIDLILIPLILSSVKQFLAFPALASPPDSPLAFHIQGRFLPFSNRKLSVMTTSQFSIKRSVPIRAADWQIL
jgi:hypothetical protein